MGDALDAGVGSVVAGVGNAFAGVGVVLLLLVWGTGRYQVIRLMPSSVVHTATNYRGKGLASATQGLCRCDLEQEQHSMTSQVTAAAGIAAAAVGGNAVAGAHAVVAGIWDAVAGADRIVAGMGDAVAGADHTVASVGDAVVAGVVDAVGGVGNGLLPCCNGSCLQVW